MSQRLAPFALLLAQPPSSDPLLKRVAKPIRETMDVAKNPVFKSFLAGSFSGTCSTILFQVGPHFSLTSD